VRNIQELKSLESADVIWNSAGDCTQKKSKKQHISHGVKKKKQLDQEEIFNLLTRIAGNVKASNVLESKQRRGKQSIEIV
jgi:hypothetical protein